MKVALVLYGQPRFVHLPWSYLSHKILLRGVDFRVIGHCWFDRSSAMMETSEWSGLGRLNFDSDAPKYILENYQDSQIKFEKPLRPTKPASTEYNNLLSHLTSLHKAINLLNEANIRESFDLVVLSRFDSVFVAFPNLRKLDIKNLHLTRDHDRFPDFVIIGPPHLISAVDALEQLQEFSPLEIPPPAEELKQKAFLKKYGKNQIALMTAAARPLRSKGFATSIIRLYVNFFFERLYSTFRGKF